LIDRYIAIQAILRRVEADDLVLSTTGMISREVFVTDDRPANFYMIGSMGLLSSFGLGLALQSPGQRVYVLEGDGSALMSLGAMALIATERPNNLVHIILDNEAYESTGSQPSISSKIDLAEIGKSCGYSHVARVEDVESLEGVLQDNGTIPGPRLILVKVGIAPVKDIPRVSHAPTEIRDRFKAKVESGS
jgi:thiamine pyrophosphate-dependent acetolactate synthase large subunit-like protein